MGVRLPVSLGRKMLSTLLSAENRTVRVFQIPVSLAPFSSKGPSMSITRVPTRLRLPVRFCEDDCVFTSLSFDFCLFFD